jgi:uncharacterized protein (DUF2141 family)
MKNKNTILVVGILLLSSLIFFSSCKKKSDTTPTPVTQVVGTASFPAGVSGDLSNAKVSLYTSVTEWQNNIPVKYGAVKGSGASVTFALTDILPGTYYLDVWKDIDNSGTWSTNDFVGWYGTGSLGSVTLTPFQVSSGSTYTANVSMFIVAK